MDNVIDKMMVNKLHELIKSINDLDKLACVTIENIDDIDNDDNDDNNYNNYVFNPEDKLRGAALINHISILADEVFITNEGHVNHENIQYLYKINKNYNVFSIEQDRFGWLIGGIETEKGVITFG